MPDEPAVHVVVLGADNGGAVELLSQRAVTMKVAQGLRLVVDLAELFFYQGLLDALRVVEVKDAGLIFLTTTGDTASDLELVLWVCIRSIRRVRKRIKIYKVFQLLTQGG